MGSDVELRAFDALGKNARLSDLVAIARAMLVAAAEARKSEWRDAAKVSSMAEELKLTGDDATTDPTVRPASGSDVGPTLAGFALGTPGYMSPEQANGLHATVTPASDVFGLGAILYCILTNHKPFEGTSLDDEITLTKKGQFPPAR